MHINFYICLVLTLLSVSIYSNTISFRTGLISEDLRHELNTHEVILERIIKHYDKNKVLSHHNVASYYIEGFGALFEAQRFPTPESNIFNLFEKPESKTKYVWSEEKNAIVKFESKHSRQDSLALLKILDEYIRDLHLAVFEFFADYMSRANWLKENEKVYVHFDINIYRKIPKEYDRSMVEHIVPLSLQASVTNQDLEKFNTGILSLDQFDKKIKIDKIFMNSQKYNYNILGDVIESEVRSIKEGNERPFTLHTTSIKIPDVGVLYFLVAHHRSNQSFDNVGSIFEYLFGRSSKNKEENNQGEIFKKSKFELQMRVAKSVGQYAHKFKDIKENEYIIIFVNIGRYGGFKSRFVMKIKKQQVDQFEQNRISFDDYLEKVEIYEEEFYLNK